MLLASPVFIVQTKMQKTCSFGSWHCAAFKRIGIHASERLPDSTGEERREGSDRNDDEPDQARLDIGEGLIILERRMERSDVDPIEKGLCPSQVLFPGTG
jgi:hypothetical protein